MCNLSSQWPRNLMYSQFLGSRDMGVSSGERSLFCQIMPMKKPTPCRFVFFTAGSCPDPCEILWFHFPSFPTSSHNFRETISCLARDGPRVTALSLEQVLIWRNNYTVPPPCSIRARPQLRGATELPLGHSALPCRLGALSTSVLKLSSSFKCKHLCPVFCWIVWFHGGKFDPLCSFVTAASHTGLSH